MGLSPGLNFESRIFFKSEGGRLLEHELSSRKYVRIGVHIIGNTDPCRPHERELKITRGVLEVGHRRRTADGPAAVSRCLPASYQVTCTLPFTPSGKKPPLMTPAPA